ncbi:HTH 48 domain-containing protein, partial [Aphis craccivora]
NAPAHSALSVKRFLAKNRTPVLQHPPIFTRYRSMRFLAFSKTKKGVKDIARKGFPTLFQPMEN